MKLMRELNLLLYRSTVLVLLLTIETRCSIFDDLKNGMKSIFPNFKPHFDVTVERLHKKKGDDTPDEHKNAIYNSSGTEPSDIKKEKNMPHEDNNASKNLNKQLDSVVKTYKPGKDEIATKDPYRFVPKIPIDPRKATDISFLNSFADKSKNTTEYFKNFTGSKSTDDKGKSANKETKAFAESKPQPNVPEGKSPKVTNVPEKKSTKNKLLSFFERMLCKISKRFCAEKDAS